MIDKLIKISSLTGMLSIISTKKSIWDLQSGLKTENKVRAYFCFVNSSRSGLQQFHMLMLELWEDLPVQHYPVMTIRYLLFLMRYR